MSKDYYEILGVTKTATKDDIKKAFHKMAHKYHPDKSGGDEARFKEVNEAYQILSDEKKRAQYDQYGQTFDGAGPGGFQGQGFPGGFDFSQGGFDMGDIGDIFSDFFGGGMGGGGRARRGRDISTEITISFAESIYGVTRTILLNKQSTCVTCEGTGAKPHTKSTTCKKCNGKGQVNEVKKSFLGTFSTVKMCGECMGTGQVPEEYCKDCRGEGVLQKQEEIEIKIPSGIENGEMVRLTGMGEAISRAPSGDLYIKINVERHPTFKREGQNLTMELNIKLTDALLGADYSISMLDGSVLKVKIPEGVSPNEILRVKEKGVPAGKGRKGDLMIKLNVNLPHKLNKSAKLLVEKLKEEGI